MKTGIIGCLLCFMSAWGYAQDKGKLKQLIQQVIDTSKADVGVAIIGLDFKDTVLINGNKHFVMQSVYKFPLAMAILNKVEKGKISMSHQVLVPKSSLDSQTHSPLYKNFKGT